MSQYTETVAPAPTGRRNGGRFTKLAVAGFLATVGLLALPGVASAYPLIGS